MKFHYLVAGLGIAPRPGAYETPEILLLYPAVYQLIYRFTLFQGFYFLFLFPCFLSSGIRFGINQYPWNIWLCRFGFTGVMFGESALQIISLTYIITLIFKTFQYIYGKQKIKETRYPDFVQIFDLVSKSWILENYQNIKFCNFRDYFSTPL